MGRPMANTQAVRQPIEKPRLRREGRGPKRVQPTVVRQVALRHRLPSFMRLVRRIFQAQSFHLLVQGRAVDAQRLSSQVAIPVVRSQYIENDLTLGTFKGFLKRLSDLGPRLQ